MKLFPYLLSILLASSSGTLLTGCASTAAKKTEHPAPAKGHGDKRDGKSVQATDEELDEYSTASIADPLEPLNRATFLLNEGIYTVLLRPISKGYEKVVPKPVRRGISNAFENVKFPVRFVNDTLQGNFKRAGQETGKFLVNSVAGVGGIGRPSDHVACLADVPAADTGQTFAKWGIGHGIYIVLPVLGPSSVRDTVGYAGDYVLNPVNWISILYGGYTWTIAIPSTNGLRQMPDQFGQYDAATKNSLDRYLAARSAYVQYRREIAKK